MNQDKTHVLNIFSYCPKCGNKAFYPCSEKSKKCEQCGFVYFLNPSAAVVALIYNIEGEILLCTRAKDPQKGTLDLPGGFVDANETAEQAICREVKEELNLNVKKAKYLFSIPNNYLYSNLNIPTLDIFYECEVDDFSTMHAADDVAAAHFAAINQIDPADIGLKSIRKAIVLLQNGKHNTNLKK